MQKRSGFTLAEVLITLGIIGVVAAMTIPTLMTNTTSSQFKTAFKKSVSALKQAITMNVALDDFDFRVLVNSTDAEHIASKKSMPSIITSRFEGAKDVTDSYFSINANDGTVVMEINADHICTAQDVDDKANGVTGALNCTEVGDVISGTPIKYNLKADNFIVYQMADGTAFGFNKNAADCVSETQENCVGFIDTNGLAAPNKLTECDNAQFEHGVSCVVSKGKIFDIFPVVFYNQSVAPATTAGHSILMGLDNINKAN